MATKKISSSMPDKVEEVTIAVRSEGAGLYRKLTTVSVRDRKTGTTKTKKGKTTVSDELYRLTASTDYDFSMEYQDISGETCVMLFKKVDD